jgi:diguanylate cyclase (GGDEF)-like protein
VIASFPGPLAIVADDEDLGRMLLAEAAKAAGLTPLVFDNGAEAVAAALENDVVIVLLDVDMPELDGFCACQQIRQAKRASLPIVMVTGLNDRSAVNRAFESGATDFISKPVNWSLLPHRLAYFLRNADREAKILTLVEAMPDALWVVSPQGELRWSQNNRALPADASAASPDTVIDIPTIAPEERSADVLRAISQTANDGVGRTVELRSDSGSPAHWSADLRFSRCEGGDVLIVRQDTTERTAAARHIEQLAFYDTLTGLPNRQHCEQVAARNLAQADARHQEVAFLYVDLNGFKRINDTFGHSVGDTVLQKVATVVSSTLVPFRSFDGELCLARLGGDEFVIVVRHINAREVALEISQIVCAALEAPITHDTLEFMATPSIGMAVYPKDGRDVEQLLKHADTAMYQAKVNGGAKIVAYTAAMSARLRNTLDLETRLRRALRANALDVRFQPKFSLKDGALVGAEALVRWFDDELGEVPPNRFIPVAEESGLIVDIGAWILRAVCGQLRLWYDATIAIPVAVNISGKELLFADPARVIKTETDRAGIPASLIEAEITESVFVTDAMAGRSSVERIRQLGCQIALDDFGTGYSSLSYLTQFPPDRLKIDRSFINNIDRSENDRAIVKAIVSLAKSLGLLVTAEGIERQAQVNWLKASGCDEVQGYLFARPLSSRDLESQFLRAFDASAVKAHLSARRA